MGQPSVAHAGRRVSPERFVSRTDLSRACVYDRDFFERLIGQLRASGFDDIMILPACTRVEMSADEFLDSKETPKALVLKAQSSDSDDVVKFLVAGNDDDVWFADEDFPHNGDVDPAALYVASDDPARAHGLKGYFFDYCRAISTWSYARIMILGVASWVFVFLEAVTLAGGHFYLASTRHWYVFWDLAWMAVALHCMYKMYRQPVGLALGPRFTFVRSVHRLTRGKINDNPLVTLILAVLGTFLGGVLLNLFKITP